MIVAIAKLNPSLIVQVVAPGGDVTKTTDKAQKGGILGAYPAKFSGNSGDFVKENGAFYTYLQVRLLTQCRRVACRAPLRAVCCPAI